MTATCLHCDGACRLTNGEEVYPQRPDLHHKNIYVCDHCDARVGCHGDTTRPLGHAANKATRNARSTLHDQMLDPLWKNEPDRKEARTGVYRFLARALSIEPRDCHTGMITIERCRDAWRALKDQTPETIRAWNEARRTHGQESHSNRQSKKHGRRRRRTSRNDAKPITGSRFDYAQAALDEVPW